MLAAGSNVRVTSGMLAEALKGRLVGPADVEVTGIEALHAASPTDLSFLRSGRFAAALANSRCAAALVSDGAIDAEAALAANPGRPLIIVKDADHAVIGLLEMLAPKAEHRPGRHPSAVIAPDAVIAESVSIGANCTVGAGCRIGEGSSIGPGVALGENVSIGRGCVVHANVVIERDCVLQDGVILHGGVVIGADGFGYRPAPDGKGLVKIPHIGNVVIESGVEIGANSCVDRGKFGATRVGAGTKIDNLVQIGHNAQIGRCCVICGCCAIGGSARLGDGVTLAGQVGIADGRVLGSGVTVGAASGVMDDIPAGETWFGYPARGSRQAMRILAAMERLAEMVQPLRRLIRDHETKKD